MAKCAGEATTDTSTFLHLRIKALTYKTFATCFRRYAIPLKKDLRLLGNSWAEKKGGLENVCDDLDSYVGH